MIAFGVKGLTQVGRDDRLADIEQYITHLLYRVGDEQSCNQILGVLFFL